MKIETRSVYDVLVVDMSGRLDSMSSGDAGDRIVDIAKGEHKRVLLNLEKLEYVSSAGLRVLLLLAKQMRADKGSLALCGLGDRVRQVFELAGFLPLFRIASTRGAALDQIAV